MQTQEKTWRHHCTLILWQFEYAKIALGIRRYLSDHRGDPQTFIGGRLLQEQSSMHGASPLCITLISSKSSIFTLIDESILYSHHTAQTASMFGDLWQCYVPPCC